MELAVELAVELAIYLQRVVPLQQVVMRRVRERRRLVQRVCPR